MRDQSELADCLERLVKQLMHLSEADLVEVLADLDLSFTQVRMLFALTRAGGAVPINELAVQVGQSVATAGRNVDALVRLGMVDRTENPADRRVKLVSIAPVGREVVDRHVTARRNAFQAFADRLPQPQSHALLEALLPVVAGFDSVCGTQANRPSANLAADATVDATAGTPVDSQIKEAHD